MREENKKKKQADAVVPYIQENVGHPESVELIEAQQLGQRHWTGDKFADDPNPPQDLNYDVMRVKYRAGREGNIREHDKAMLFRGDKPVGLVPYPHADLIDLFDKARKDAKNRAKSEP